MHTHVLGGWRSVDHDVFEGHPVGGLEVDLYRPEAPFGYEIGLSYGTEDEDVGALDVEGQFYEGYLGIRKTWGSGGVHPYVGLGGTYGVIDRNSRTPIGQRISDDEVGAGGYVHAGAYWVIGGAGLDSALGASELTLGFDLRGVVGDDADYGQAAITLGFGR